MVEQTVRENQRKLEQTKDNPFHLLFTIFYLLYPPSRAQVSSWFFVPFHEKAVQV
jgi:hypothetical protein